jgi:putative aminopeptidase FrvX
MIAPDTLKPLKINDSEASEYFEVLKELVSIPTASFHEEAVCARIKDYLNEYRIPYEVDKWGNIIAHYQKGASLPRPLVLMAHTDHPAFELTGKKEDKWVAQLLGGVSPRCFDHPVPVKIVREANTFVYGKVTGYFAPSPRDVTLYIELENNENVKEGDFGVWDLKDFELKDGMIHARVIDDLVGVAAALLTLQYVSFEAIETDVYALFTRAEEVGLVGADLLFSDGTLPKSSLVVSLEASKTIPGAEQGKGPVIRAGDRTFSFNETAEFLLKCAATNLGGSTSTRDPQDTLIQRQLMIGGNCEAGSALMNGYNATGMAFSLGNYHNVTADFGIAEENIHQQDYLTGVCLLQEAARILPELPEYEQSHRAKYTAISGDLSKRLSDTAHKFKD